MAHRNRVTPRGTIEAIEQTGAFLGNRGCLHEGVEIVRPFQTKRWITCRTEFRNRAVPQWEPGLYTVLFFLDEAVALAAGHRPCAECRRDRYNEFRSAWAAGVGPVASAEELDRCLHVDRLDGDVQRTHQAPWATLPTGTFAIGADGEPVVVLAGAVVPWASSGYGAPRRRPDSGEATVLTPQSTVATLAAGYELSLGAFG